jgi:exopolysaccharide biosynthesis polyprenyl glycosylphosphotransferase
MIIENESRKILKYTFFIFSYALIIYCAFTLSYFIRFNSGLIPIFKDLPPFDLYNRATIIITVIWVFLFFQMSFFDRVGTTIIDDLLSVIKIVSIGTIFALALNFFYREYMYSRIVIALSWFLSILFIFCFNQIISIVKKFFHVRKSTSTKILLIGNAKIGKLIKHRIRDRYLGKAIFYPYEQNFSKLENYIERKKINELILLDATLSHKILLDIANICEYKKVLFKFMPDILELRMGEITVDNDLELPLLQIKPTSFLDSNFVKKRIFDVTVSLIIFSLLILPMLFIALIIKITSEGAILYKQKRVGLNGDKFIFYKFRTMIINADEMVSSLKNLSDRQGPVFKMKNDPRITIIGRILRKYSLDELPQFFNVLLGDMSIVGPRPQVVWEAENYDKEAKRRLNVLPGITCIWQISGRSDLSYEEMIKLDLYYIESWSLTLDIKIILNTIPAVLLGKGAY